MPSVLLINRVYVLKVNGSGEKSSGVPKIGHFFEVTFWADPAKVDVRSLANWELSLIFSSVFLFTDIES